MTAEIKENKENNVTVSEEHNNNAQNNEVGAGSSDKSEDLPTTTTKTSHVSETKGSMRMGTGKMRKSNITPLAPFVNWVLRSDPFYCDDMDFSDFSDIDSDMDMDEDMSVDVEGMASKQRIMELNQKILEEKQKLREMKSKKRVMNAERRSKELQRSVNIARNHSLEKSARHKKILIDTLQEYVSCMAKLLVENVESGLKDEQLLAKFKDGISKAKNPKETMDAAVLFAEENPEAARALNRIIIHDLDRHRALDKIYCRGDKELSRKEYISVIGLLKTYYQLLESNAVIYYKNRVEKDDNVYVQYEGVLGNGIFECAERQSQIHNNTVVWAQSSSKCNDIEGEMSHADKVMKKLFGVGSYDSVGSLLQQSSAQSLDGAGVAANGSAAAETKSEDKEESKAVKVEDKEESKAVKVEDKEESKAVKGVAKTESVHKKKKPAKDAEKAKSSDGTQDKAKSWVQKIEEQKSDVKSMEKSC